MYLDYNLSMVKKVKLVEQNSKLERCLKIETELYGSVIIIVDFIYKNFLFILLLRVIITAIISQFIQQQLII